MIINLIIPTYNNKDTLDRTLSSIVCQTNNKRIITSVIDDYSDYDIQSIVNNYKNKININYVKPDNKIRKPGLVRQYGIDRTNADYIMFLDADDILIPNATEVLHNAIHKEQYDFINSAFYREENGKYEIITPNKITWLHGNIYSRKFLDKYEIRFDDRMNEDGSFNLKCFWLADKRGIIDKPMAYWMGNKNSLTRSSKNFMIDIAEDYVNTYSDALKFIVNKKEEVLQIKKFQADCAAKLAQFLEFLDAQIYYKGQSSEEIFSAINRYIDFLNDNSLITTPFLNQTNYEFNKFNIFPCVIRQNTLLDYFDFFKINYSSWQKKNLEDFS